MAEGTRYRIAVIITVGSITLAIRVGEHLEIAFIEAASRSNRRVIPSLERICHTHLNVRTRSVN